MAETIYIGDSIVDAETKVLFDRQDFVDLVREKLGNDAETYLKDFLEDMYHDGYSQGYADGHENGYDAGYYFGRDD